MYRYLIIPLFFILTSLVPGDLTHSGHSLTWISVSESDRNGIMSDFFRFEGAVYGDRSPYLPYFVKRLSTSSTTSMEAEIVQPFYIEWEGEVPSGIAGLIGEKPEVRVNVLRSGNDVFAEISFIPIILKDGKIYLLKKFGIKITEQTETKSLMTPFAWKSGSMLASGKWVKIKTSRKGIYRIPFEKLSSLGFSDPSKVNVYGYGGYALPESLAGIPFDDMVVNATWQGKDGSGKDCLYFFSTGNVKWEYDPVSKRFRHQQNVYANESFYFLSTEGPRKNVAKFEPVTGQSVRSVNEYDDYVRYENELINLISSGSQWFGESFLRGTNRNFSLACPDAVTGMDARVTINAAGRSSGSSALDITINGSKQSGLVFNPVNTDDATTLYASEKQNSWSIPVSSGKIDVSIQYAATNNLSNAWLDYITVNWRRKLQMNGDELYFRDTGSMAGQDPVRYEVGGSASGMRVFDITQPEEIIEVPVTIEGTLMSFVRPSGGLREYVAFKPAGNFPEPDYVGDIPNQNLHGLDTPDFLIITHPDFLQISEEIADFHRTRDAMKVHVANTVQVYNEFGSGNPDATAIRNFIRMFYDRDKKIKYVMLVGDGSYDNRNIKGGSRAMITTYQSENSLVPTSSFVSDDYFVILDEGESVYNGLVDLGIGRLPVATQYEARIVAGKILSYYSANSLGMWRNIVTFIGDDGDGGLHMGDSESLANHVNSVHREFQTDKIYFDAYPVSSTPAGKRYPGVTDAINQRVRDGVLVLNYVGHANERFMADERVLDISTINAWTNKDKLPIFVTATCEFSRFDADETSAGEYILLNPNGGGIGLFSTTRVVYAYSNFLLSQNFYRYIFEKDVNGENYRMGDVMRLAKINTVNTLNKRNFSLLANPALRLSYPKYRVETTSLNNAGISETADTLSALSKVTIAGIITDISGQKLNNFYGTITSVVYDKEQRMNTLGNSGQTPFSYKVQNNVIYKGQTTVRNGEFSFSFVIPKDISYNIGKGRILYYAENGSEDANGFFEGFYIGGSSGGQVVDNEGPEIELYMDDTSFQSGDETSQNPLLIARLFDENGINTVGSGIGHDITAVLNEDYSKVYILNEFYKSDQDEYRSGTIEFPFRNLPPGEHSLKLKAWDVANNSTEAEIKFVVTGDFMIESVTNYPNPLTDHTYFVFTHNQPDATFRTLIEIFDMTGKRVDMVQVTTSSSGKTSTPLRWSPGEKGLRLRGGVYPFRITIRSDDGRLAAKSGRFTISP